MGTVGVGPSFSENIPEPVGPSSLKPELPSSTVDEALSSDAQALPRSCFCGKLGTCELQYGTMGYTFYMVHLPIVYAILDAFLSLLGPLQSFLGMDQLWLWTPSWPRTMIWSSTANISMFISLSGFAVAKCRVANSKGGSDPPTLGIFEPPIIRYQKNHNHLRRLQAEPNSCRGRPKQQPTILGMSWLWHTKPQDFPSDVLQSIPKWKSIILNVWTIGPSWAIYGPAA